jgi:hypothetical protein
MASQRDDDREDAVGQGEDPPGIVLTLEHHPGMVAGAHWVGRDLLLLGHRNNLPPNHPRRAVPWPLRALAWRRAGSTIIVERDGSGVTTQCRRWS